MTEDEEEQECVSGDTRRCEYIGCIARATALGLGIMLDFLVQFGEGAIQTDETPNKSQVWVGGAKNVLIIPSNMRCTHNAVTFATGGQWL